MAFHITSIWVPLLILIPNLLFGLFPPRNLPGQTDFGTGLLFLTVLERMGQIGIYVLPLLTKPQWAPATRFYAVVMALSLGLYYAGWIRYFIGGRDYALLFSSLWMIPLPMALGPVLYFAAAAGLLRSNPLFVTVIVFASGHIPLSYGSFKAIQE